MTGMFSSSEPSKLLSTHLENRFKLFVTAPHAVLIRPDGYVAWVGDGTQMGLTDALSTWFGPPVAKG